MEEYSSYPWGETCNYIDLGLWGETYNYDYPPTSGFDYNGLHDEVDTNHGFSFVYEDNDHLLGGFNDISSMNPISTPGQVFIDDFTSSSYDDDELMILSGPDQAPFKPSGNHPSHSVNSNEEDQSFSDVKVALPMATNHTSNSTLKNPSPVFPEKSLDLSDANHDMSFLNTQGQLEEIPKQGFSYPDETKPLITDKAQGLPKPCPKMMSRKSSKPKDKLNQVMKVVSAAELESDQWVWKKYGTKDLKRIGRPRRYYRCQLAGLEYEKCEAKRYVNESCTVPNAYDVIYIGHHNHSPPTHSSYPTRKRTRHVKIKKEEEWWSN